MRRAGSGDLVGVVDLDGSALNGGAPAVNDNAWHHIVIILNNNTPTNIPSSDGLGGTVNDNIRVYFDGSSTQRPVNFIGTANLGPGTFGNHTPILGAVTFAGAIDDFRIYSGMLTTTQIAALYAAGPQ